MAESENKLLLGAEEMTFNQSVTLIQTLGVPVAILIVLTWGVIKICRWIAPDIKLVVKHHIAFLQSNTQLITSISKDLEKTTDIHQQQLEVNTSILGVLDELRDQHQSHRTPFSTIGTNDALTYLADAIDEESGNKPEIKKHTDKMRKVLKDCDPRN